MTTAFPRISVVTITYGHENYIIDCLLGILNQQYGGLVEFIIANDNSPDNTDQIIKTFLQQNLVPDNFTIKYTNHPQNKGMMGNFIWALEQATGKYIALCEGDDYWTDPMKLQKQVDFLEENNNIVLCGTDYDVLVNGKLIKKKESSNIQIYSHKDIFVDNRVATLTVLFRNNFIRPSYFDKCNFGDMILLLELTKNGRQIAALPFKGAVYRIHEGGAFSGTTQVNNTKKGLADLHLFFKYNKTKNYLSTLFSIYVNVALKHFVRAILLRPNSDIRQSVMIFKFIYKEILRFFSHK